MLFPAVEFLIGMSTLYYSVYMLTIAVVSTTFKCFLFSGATTFPGLRKFIADKSQTRVLSLLHIAAHGLASAGCTGWGMQGFF